MSTYRWQQKYIQKRTGMTITSGGGRQGDRLWGGGRRYDMIKVGYFQASSFNLVGSWLLINII